MKKLGIDILDAMLYDYKAKIGMLVLEVYYK